MSATQYSSNKITQWYQSKDDPIFLGDVVDADSGTQMSVGFARYAKGAQNDWVVTYDEALIVTKGQYSVVTDEGTATAKAGEVIYLTKGTKLTYRADEETEVVYVSYPHWAKAQSESEHAHFMDTFHPVPTDKVRTS